MVEATLCDYMSLLKSLLQLEFNDLCTLLGHLHTFKHVIYAHLQSHLFDSNEDLGRSVKTWVKLKMVGSLLTVFRNLSFVAEICGKEKRLYRKVN